MLDPEYMPQDALGHFVLYHWSPVVNRESIEQQGLKIRSQALQGDWKPPFTAFALSPQLAWILSAGRTDYEVQHEEWDLWAVWSKHPNRWELLFFDDEGVKEVRVYRSIAAKYLWRVGTRSREVSNGN